MTEPTPGPNTDLPPLEMFKARSTWVVLVAAVMQIAAFAKVDLLGFVGVAGQEQLVDGIMQVVAAIALVWTWLERRAPNYRLTVGTDKTRSPAIVGIAALVLVLALAGCGADGSLKRPQDMTPVERCENAETVLALMEANGVGPATLRRAEANVALLCGAEKEGGNV